jgi:hypothetical protein
MYIYIITHMYICAYICIFLYVYEYVFVSIYICIYINLNCCLNIIDVSKLGTTLIFNLMKHYVYINIYIYTYIYMYVHIPRADLEFKSLLTTYAQHVLKYTLYTSTYTHNQSYTKDIVINSYRQYMNI